MYFVLSYPAADSCGQLQTLWGVCMERVWGRPLGYVTLWDPKEHFSEENSSPGGPGATPHHAYLTYPHLYIDLTSSTSAVDQS